MSLLQPQVKREKVMMEVEVSLVRHPNKNGEYDDWQVLKVIPPARNKIKELIEALPSDYEGEEN